MGPRILDVALWLENGDYAVRKGFTRKTAEDMNVLRIGRLCIAWEVRRDG